MILARGRVRVALRPPRDLMVGERLRSLLNRLRLGARTPALLARVLLRRRALPPSSPATVARLLVVHTGRLGEMALTARALQALRAHFSRAEITVLAPPDSLALLKAHPAVDHRAPLREDRLPEWMAGRFDLAIDFTSDPSLQGARLVARSRAPLRAGFRAFGRQAHFNLRGPKAVLGRHILDLNHELLASLGVAATPTPPGPSLFVTDEERGKALAVFATLGAAEPRVIVHPGARRPTQAWPPERYAEVIERLTERSGAACIVLAGPGEEELAARVCAATPDALLAPEQPVRGLMALIAASELFVGNNSGPLHVASALGVPTVSVMGPTDPARFSPRGPADRAVRRAIACSPCGRVRCWHHTCLLAIEPEEVLAEAEASLRESLPRRQAR